MKLTLKETKKICVERIRIENMELSMQNMLNKVTIQEPTFDRVIVVYRRASNDAKRERGIYVKHFRNIPMADMEIVSPEKKNPSLTQWTGFNSLLLLPLSCLHLSAPLKVLKLMYRSLLPFSLGLWTIVLGFISRFSKTWQRIKI